MTLLRSAGISMRMPTRIYSYSFDKLLERVTVRMENCDACTKAACDRLYSLA